MRGKKILTLKIITVNLQDFIADIRNSEETLKEFVTTVDEMKHLEELLTYGV